MKPNCILLYGNHDLPITKYAGTFRIASELRKHGYSTQCVDLTAFNGLDNELKLILTNLISEKTLWIGISTTFLFNIFGFPYVRSQKSFDTRFSYNNEISNGIKSFVEFIKQLNPNIKLIAGGSRRFMLEQFGFKIFKFYSDTEIIDFTKWCEKTNSQIRLDFYSNVIEGSEYKDFHTSQILFEKEDIIDFNDTLPMEVSRGCIFKCKFCSFPMNGKTKGDWLKQSNVLLDEFKKNYELHGITNYIFSDDTYNDSEEKVKRLYDEVYSKLPFKLSFTTYIRLDLMIRFPNTVEYLQESGLKSALFGIETINHDSGKAVGKGLDPKIQFEFLEEIKKNQFKQIQTHSGFIIGLPKDKEDEIERLEEFIFSDKNKLDYCIVEPLFITPREFSNINKNYYSEFDLEYEKYGYECYEQIENSAFTEIRWKNNITGMTFDRAFEFSRRINEKISKSDKFKIGGFAFGFFKSLGISEADLLTLSRAIILQKYDIKKLIEEKKLQYKTNLLNLSTALQK